MGDDDDLQTSVAHIVLSCVAGQGLIRGTPSKNYTQSGMHVNFLIHGILGILHYRNGGRDNDFAAAHAISLQATKYLPLPCLMADLTRSKSVYSLLHLSSGVIPYLMALKGMEVTPLDHVANAYNIASLCYYSYVHRNPWGWSTAGAAVVAYYLSHKVNGSAMYPLALGSVFNNDFTNLYMLSWRASRYLPLPCLLADLNKGDQVISLLHLASGAVPFCLALADQDNPPLGHLMIACNVVALCYYSHKNNKEWGWYTVGAAVLAYFVTFQVKKPVIYPLCLALMQYCANRIGCSSVTVLPPPPRR